jgi:DNA-binding response OmpR family regulator
MEQSSRLEATRPLAGARILVVEDDFLLLMELEGILNEAGAESVATCRTLRQAFAMADGENIAAAILDIRIGSENIAPVARMLASRGTPFVFYTAESKNDCKAFLAEWPGCTIVPKPAPPTTIVAATTAALAAARPRRIPS